MTACLLLAGAFLAAPRPELMREEAFNYRIVGKLPAGWKRRGDSLTWTYFIDGIPHAHVHFLRQRVRGALDLPAEVRKRAEQYRFPGVPRDAPLSVGTTLLAGHEAVLCEHRAKVAGVACSRRATVLVAKSVWYELIETVYGETTASDDRCRDGLTVFRRGFRLLTDAVPEADLDQAGAQTYTNREFGYRITKPAGFLRLEVNTGADPGCRVAFERSVRAQKQHIRVRLFEFGVREKVEPEQWFERFFLAFAANHMTRRRKSAEPPQIPGALWVVAEQFTGIRDKVETRTLIVLMQARSRRVFALRVRTQGEGLAAQVEKVTASLQLD